MFKNLIKAFVLSGFFILNFVFIHSANAATETVSGNVNQADTFFDNAVCAGHYEAYTLSVTVTGNYSLSFNSVDFTDVTAIGAFEALISPDSSPTPMWLAETGRYTDGTIVNANNPVNLTAGLNYYLVLTACNYNPATHNYLYTSASYSLTISGLGDIILAPVTGSNGNNASDIVYPPDNRINWQYGDLHAVMYEHLDGVVVYCYDGVAWFAMLINQELVDSWDTSLPQELPVLEVNQGNCRAAFYMLDSGEYQLNIWSYEGKLYEIIADNLNFRDAEMRYLDPNE